MYYKCGLIMEGPHISVSTILSVLELFFVVVVVGGCACVTMYVLCVRETLLRVKKCAVCVNGLAWTPRLCVHNSPIIHLYTFVYHNFVFPLYLCNNSRPTLRHFTNR